jgi:hypothetical protein
MTYAISPSFLEDPLLHLAKNARVYLLWIVPSLAFVLGVSGRRFRGILYPHFGIATLAIAHSLAIRGSNVDHIDIIGPGYLWSAVMLLVPFLAWFFGRQCWLVATGRVGKE